jgi:exodeoxyribonuclease V alpha subunit
MQGLEGEFICYKPTYFHTELNLAERVYQLLQHKHHPDPERVNAWIDRYTTQRNIQLSPKQREAVEMAANSSLL